MSVKIETTRTVTLTIPEDTAEKLGSLLAHTTGDAFYEIFDALTDAGVNVTKYVPRIRVNGEVYTARTSTLVKEEDRYNVDAENVTD
jgi:hypothetical protein